MTNVNPNTKQSLSHKAAIKEALLAGETLTPLDALNRFGCFRLGARIWDLKNEGMSIRTDWKILSNGKKVAAYKLAV